MAKETGVCYVNAFNDIEYLIKLIFVNHLHTYKRKIKLDIACTLLTILDTYLNVFS